MGMFGGGSKPHVADLPPAPAPAPTPVDPNVLKAHSDSLSAAARAAAGASNVSNTGGNAGLDNSSVNLVKKQLLGQ